MCITSQLYKIWILPLFPLYTVEINTPFALIQASTNDQRAPFYTSNLIRGLNQLCTVLALNELTLKAIITYLPTTVNHSPINHSFFFNNLNFNIQFVYTQPMSSVCNLLDSKSLFFPKILHCYLRRATTS